MMPPASRWILRAALNLLVRELVKDADGDGIPDSLEGLLSAAEKRAKKTKTEIDDRAVAWLVEMADAHPDWAEDVARTAVRRAHRA